MNPRHLIPALFCALLIAYPLSTAPVVMVYYKYHPSATALPHWMDDFYGPVRWLCQHSKPMNDAFARYFWLWIPSEA